MPTTTRARRLTDASPFVGALAFPERAVEQRDVDAEVVPQPVDERRRERDLRHEHERGAPGSERVRDRGRVDRGLAARGLALEQEREGSARRERPADPLDRILPAPG